MKHTLENSHSAVVKKYINIRWQVVERKLRLAQVTAHSGICLVTALFDLLQDRCADPGKLNNIL